MAGKYQVEYMAGKIIRAMKFQGDIPHHFQFFCLFDATEINIAALPYGLYHIILDAVKGKGLARLVPPDLLAVSRLIAQFAGAYRQGCKQVIFRSFFFAIAHEFTGKVVCRLAKEEQGKA
jgi:hypothetical protein